MGSSRWVPSQSAQLLRTSVMAQVPNFVGQIQQLKFNNIDFFEELVGGQSMFASSVAGPSPTPAVQPRNLIVQNSARVVDIYSGIVDEITFKVRLLCTQCGRLAYDSLSARL